MKSVLTLTAEQQLGNKLNLERFPYEGLINKGITGCGATTIPLYNEEKAVVLVPYVTIIKSKTGMNSAGSVEIDVLGKKQLVFVFYGSIIYKGEVIPEIKAEFEAFLAKGGKKIIGTYDSLKKIDLLINPSEWNLYVDEYHKLTKEYNFRSAAISYVLNRYKAYAKHYFISATPVNEMFIPTELQNEDVTDIVWSNAGKPEIYLVNSSDPTSTLITIIKKFKKYGYITLEGNNADQVICFINSVKIIAKIIRKCGLTADDTTVIVANTSDNVDKLNDFPISDVNDELKKIVFITSKGFDGCDLFSQNGIQISLSDDTKFYTLIDTVTDMPQIAGRIRTKSNPFFNKLIHIYNTNMKTINIEALNDYKAFTTDNVIAAENLAKLYNEATRKYLKESYAEMIGMLNEEIIKIDSQTDTAIVNRDIIKEVEYKVSVLEKYKDLAGYIRDENKLIIKELKKITAIKDPDEVSKAPKKPNFKEIYKEAMKYKSTNEIDENLALKYQNILNQNQTVSDAVTYGLTEEQILNCKYESDLKKLVNAAKIKKSNSESNDKVFKILAMRMKFNEWYKGSDVKAILQSVYDELGLKRTAKATDLKIYFAVADKIAKIDGNSVQMMKIVTTKLVKPAKIDE